MTSTDRLPLGTLLHQYRVVSVLGSGSFGVTYKAEHVTLSGRHAAIKEFFPALWVTRGAGGIEVVANGTGAQTMEPGGGQSWFEWGRERFIGEARALAAIEDEGVVQVLDFFPANGTAYFVMAYEEGEPFSARLSDSARVPELELRERLVQVLNALEAVHQARYLHRDLKPDNLYLRRRDDRLMLIDFGSARQTLGKRSQPLTSILTPGYAPIEQYGIGGEGEARRHGPWTDLYAVGAIAYQCLGGKAPVDAPARLFDDPLPAAVEIGAGRYSRELLELIDRALAVRPEARFRSAAGMREALSRGGRAAAALPTRVVTGERARRDAIEHERSLPRAAGVASDTSAPERSFVDADTADRTETRPAADSVFAGMPQSPTIAVLPFDSLGVDREQDYFADGLTEDLITALSHSHAFPVIARNSTFAFKGKPIRIQDIALELGARYVVEGSVRRSGERIRINAQLVDADTELHLWAEKFDRHFEDIFEIQDEITARIAAVIAPELEEAESKKSTLKRTQDLNAWDFYVRGLADFYQDNCEANGRARASFERATASDPGYADAWARLGWVNLRDIQLGCTEDRERALAEGFASARKAIALDARSEVARLCLGTAHVWAGDLEQGLAEAQTALAINPNYVHAALAVGNRLDLAGRTAEGIRRMEQAFRLNPRDPMRGHYLGFLARAYIGLGRYEEAAECAREAARLRPEDPDALFRKAMCVAHLDRREETESLLKRCEELRPGFLAKVSTWRPYSETARNDELFAGLRRHGFIT